MRPLAAIAFLLAASEASAQATCAPRVFLIDRLKALALEQHQFSLVQETRLIEVWMNVETRTWTVIATDLNGVACILAAGRGVIANVVPEPPGNDM